MLLIFKIIIFIDLYFTNWCELLFQFLSKLYKIIQSNNFIDWEYFNDLRYSMWNTMIDLNEAISSQLFFHKSLRKLWCIVHLYYCKLFKWKSSLFFWFFKAFCWLLQVLLHLLYLIRLCKLIGLILGKLIALIVRFSTFK